MYIEQIRSRIRQQLKLKKDVLLDMVDKDEIEEYFEDAVEQHYSEWRIFTELQWNDWCDDWCSNLKCYRELEYYRIPLSCGYHFEFKSADATIQSSIYLIAINLVRDEIIPEHVKTLTEAKTKAFNENSSLPEDLNKLIVSFV